MLKLVEIPHENYSRLLPEQAKSEIAIGDKVYHLYPMKLREWMIIKDSLVDMYAGLPEGGSMADTIMAVIETALPTMLKKMGCDNADDLTMQQAAIVAGAIYRQNFDFENLPSESKKNAQALWIAMKPILMPLVDPIWRDVKGIMSDIEKMISGEIEESGMESETGENSLPIPTS